MLFVENVEMTTRIIVIGCVAGGATIFFDSQDSRDVTVNISGAVM